MSALSDYLPRTNANAKMPLVQTSNGKNCIDCSKSSVCKYQEVVTEEVERLVEELDELTFWAVNTKEAENLMKVNEEKMTFGMSESEKEAYLLGAQNAFSITNQLLQQGVSNESIQFYNPEVERTEEFSKEEVIEWLSKQIDC